MQTKKILDSVFEGHNLTTVILKGKALWFSTEISVILGYSRPKKVSELISEKWSDEFIENEHFVVVRGESLRDLFEFAALHWGATKPLSKKARSVLFLTEPGIDLLILKTRKRVGRELRYHLSRVVLPQFRRGMLEERPLEELEAKYKEEALELHRKITSCQEKIIERDELLLARDAQLMDANYRLGIVDGSVGHVRKSARAAGMALQACKGTKKLRDMN